MVYLAYFGIFMLLQLTVSKILIHGIYGSSKLPKFYRTDFKHDLYCFTWRWLKCPCKIHLNTQCPQSSILYNHEGKSLFHQKTLYQSSYTYCESHNTFKLGAKERFEKEQIGVKEPFTITNLPFTSLG